MTTITKPVRRVAQARMPHGYADRLIITLYPGGIVEVREVRRKETVQFDLGRLYVSALIRRALAKPATRRSRSRST